MAADLFGLTASQVARLKRVLDSVEGGDVIPPQQYGRGPLQSAKVIVGILTDAVAATTALTSKPKVGTLNVYSFTSTGTTDTGLDETVYGFAPSAWTTDRWTVAERDSFTGKWVLTTQFCS